MTTLWEYAVIQHVVLPGTEAVYVYLYEDGEMVQRPVAKEVRVACVSMLGALSELGEEGWELVGSSNAGTPHTQLWLKRPLQQEANAD